MGEPKFITTPGGEELVLLSRADYDRLRDLAADAEEDAEDVAIFDERMAALKAGRDCPLPEEVSGYILRGDSLLKALRKWKGLGQTELAARAGISQNYLSSLEARKRKGTPETLEALAKGLEVEPSWLLP